MNEDANGADRDQAEPSTANAGTTDGEDVLARQLSRLARELETEDDPDALLMEVVSAAVELIPGTDEASISLVTDRRHVLSQAPSSDLAQEVDALQEETGEGPCLDAVYQEQTVRVPDMSTEERWPRFAERASAAGAASMLAFQLFVEGDNLGALNLYGRAFDAFDDESEHVGLLFASHAAVAFAGVRKQQQLSRALDTRDVIGMAKGILMQRFSISSDRAFRVLVRSSQESQRKLREVAEELVESGTLGGRRVSGHQATG
jgi:transcriptional regulator with GAF, ATPase, and Fis domain